MCVCVCARARVRVRMHVWFSTEAGLGIKEKHFDVNM
jgi:hypothetical protein